MKNMIKVVYWILVNYYYAELGALASLYLCYNQLIILCDFHLL